MLTKQIKERIVTKIKEARKKDKAELKPNKRTEFAEMKNIVEKVILFTGATPAWKVDG